MTRRTLVARMDSAGDVLLQGPAVRAIAAGSERLTMLCGPRGEAAARLLPGLDDMLVYGACWIDADPGPLDPDGVHLLIERLARLELDTAVILTSFHQSPLPLALLLRMAGVSRIGAISPEYPGSLLDVRHQVPDHLHEVERSLSLAAAMGFKLPEGDDGRLQVERTGTPPPEPAASGPYVVLHPGASAPARAWPAERHAELVPLLAARGWRVVVTGGAEERELTARVAGSLALDLGGRLDLPALTEVLAGAAVLVSGNTGPAHLAAAVGTPVVSLFSPVVPAERWRPWAVPQVLLGDQHAACAGTRARACPIPGHPCLAGVDAVEVASAVERLAPAPVTSHSQHEVAS
jgi:ADP-heptose:LPS heptosyltransferase